MNNKDIAKILRHLCVTKNYFLGVFSAEKIPKRKDIVNYPCCFVANTDPSWLPGTHWVAVFIGKDGLVEYFDSYGRRPMSPKMKAFCGRDYAFNPNAVQSILSSSCGQFCIFVLSQRCSGKSMHSIMKQFRVNNPMFNENMVLTFVNGKFPHNKLSCRRSRGIINQTCKAGICTKSLLD